MSGHTPPPSVPDSLESELARSFMPAWARESDEAGRVSRMVKLHGDTPAERPGGDRRGQPRHQTNQDRRPARSPGGKRPDRRPEGHPREEKNRPLREQPPTLDGWNVNILADPRGIEGLARQIKAAEKTYPLFGLALLVLEKPERYAVQIEPDSDAAQPLFQVRDDQSLWLRENDAVRHVLATHLEAFYRKERVPVEPPKGSYPFVASCGMSGSLIGPPNYHDYQDKLRKIHAEKFPDIPFDLYKSRIRMARDEESIQKWKDEQSFQDEFHPTDPPEGNDPVKFSTLAEVENHFRANYAATAITKIAGRILLPGPAAVHASAPEIAALVRRTWEELRRFPLPLAHGISSGLSSRGLQIFKAHENITYVSPARPRYLARETAGEGLLAILEILEARPRLQRSALWEALPIPPGGEEEHKSRAAKDLAWLLHEGHVMDYHGRGLEATRMPQAKK